MQTWNEAEEGFDLVDDIMADKGWLFENAGLKILRDREIEILYRDRSSMEVVVVCVDDNGNEKPVECYNEGDGEGFSLWVINL